MDMLNYTNGVVFQTVGLVADIDFDGGDISLEFSPSWAMNLKEVKEVLRFVHNRTDWRLNCDGERLIVSYKDADYYLPFVSAKWLLSTKKQRVFLATENGWVEVEEFCRYIVDVKQE